MDAAACIGCGGCVAACPNGAASLFTAAKVAHLGMLPQGQPERWRRSPWWTQWSGSFGSCTNHGECERACPKEISIDFIALMNRDYIVQVQEPPTPGDRLSCAAAGCHIPGCRRCSSRDVSAIEPPPLDLNAANAVSIDRVVTQQRRRLERLVAGVLDRSEAEDVVQEALIRLGADPVRHRPYPEVAPWLRRACLNLAFNRRRDLARWRQRAVRGRSTRARIPAAPTR